MPFNFLVHSFLFIGNKESTQDIAISLKMTKQLQEQFSAFSHADRHLPPAMMMTLRPVYVYYTVVSNVCCFVICVRREKEKKEGIIMLSLKRTHSRSRDRGVGFTQSASEE